LAFNNNVNNNHNVNNKTMKTKRFLVLSLLLSMAISVLQAQVRIDALSAPHSGIGSNLNRNDNTDTTGFDLPRVNLISATNPQPLANDFAVLNGAMVYNLTASGTDLKVGPYFAGDDRWISLSEDGDATNDKDIVLLDSLPVTVWLGVDGITDRPLTITTSIDNDDESMLTYQWYYLDADAIPQAIGGEIFQTFTISKGNAGSEAYRIKNPGEVKKYFCVVRNRSKLAITTRVRAVYGNGLFLNNDRWLNVLSYNLGVSEAGKSLTPEQQYAAPVEDTAITGDLYQWGRVADGHQARTLNLPAGLYAGVNTNLSGVETSKLDAATGQILDASIAGKFILRSNGAFDWRQYDASANDPDGINSPPAAWIHNPCNNLNDGDKEWRLPSSEEWSQICANNSIENTGKGLLFKPDGTHPSVFLPAAGSRSRINGILYTVGTSGYYWSSVSSNVYASSLAFAATAVNPVNMNDRSYGFSVRCVSSE
jgi:uncharacterized protein (TIGR02145 family)